MPKKNFDQIAAAYNGCVRDANALLPKERFRYLCQRVCDNLKTGTVGYVRDEAGGFFAISRDRRSAARVSENEAQDVAKLFFKPAWPGCPYGLGEIHAYPCGCLCKTLEDGYHHYINPKCSARHDPQGGKRYTMHVWDQKIAREFEVQP